MSITIHCPFHNQHNLNNFLLNSLLPKPPNSNVHSLLFPSPKFHCPLPNLSLFPDLTTHPTTPPPRHSLTIHCQLPNLPKFHHQVTNLFHDPTVHSQNFPPFPSSNCPLPNLSLPSANCPLPGLKDRVGRWAHYSCKLCVICYYSAVSQWI